MPLGSLKAVPAFWCAQTCNEPMEKVACQGAQLSGKYCLTHSVLFWAPFVIKQGRVSNQVERVIIKLQSSLDYLDMLLFLFLE